MQLATVTLPDLIWGDEFDWTPVEQSADYTLTGALIIETAVRQAGRPITLMGGEEYGWTDRATVLALAALVAQPGLEMTLTLDDAREFQVVFRQDDKPMDAGPVLAVTDPEAGDYYTLTLRLMEI